MGFLTAEPKLVQLRQGPIQYREAGDGPTLLFVHGFAVNGYLWRGVVDRLSDRFRCVVPDWPLGSHGQAMHADADLSPPGLAELVHDFADALRLPDFTLVGNDLGGAVSQLAVARRPGRVAALVLTSCDAFGNFPPPLFTYLVRLPKVPAIRDLLANLMRVKGLRRLPVTYGWLSKRGLADATIARYVEPMIHDRDVRRDAARVITQLRPRHTLEVVPKLQQFQRPVLLAWSREDRFFPFAHAEELSRLLPRAHLHPIEDAYTLSAEDQPAEVAAAIRSFAGALA